MPVVRWPPSSEQEVEDIIFWTEEGVNTESECDSSSEVHWDWFG